MGKNDELARQKADQEIKKEMDKIEKKFEKRKKKLKTLIIIDISIVLLFILLSLLDQPYRAWDYDIIEWAILGTFWEAFEWIFMRLAPIAVIVLTTIILIKRNK